MLNIRHPTRKQGTIARHPTRKRRNYPTSSYAKAEDPGIKLLRFYFNLDPSLSRRMTRDGSAQFLEEWAVASELTTITDIAKVRIHAEVVKLVDTQASGACGGNSVEVQVLSSAAAL